jgi:uncharacterized protein (DUF2147 family)
MKYILAICICVLSFFSISQSVEGVWNTYNSAGEIKSEVEIYIKDGKLYGKLIKLHKAAVAKSDARCVKCTDYRKNQPIIGMVFISGLKKSGNEWTGDKLILDPNKGEVYDVKIWLTDDDELGVRGYLGWFYQTEYWKRKK